MSWALGVAVLALVGGASPDPGSLPEEAQTVRLASGPVVGMPLDGEPIPNLPSYDGPHPASQPRPDDPVHFPIALGEVGPAEALFAGPRQYPFVCGTEKSRLGPPVVDNQEGIGTAVYALRNGERVLQGYSRDCGARSRVWYYYKPIDSEEFTPWYADADDVDQAWVGGKRVPFIVRVEMGTINRFIYALAVLRGEHETAAEPGVDRWNRRLIYQFQGGVGIGHRQGSVDPARLLKERAAQLALGYAVAYSTGNATSNHYHVWLQEDTALRVKRQFVARYGVPRYTVGIGGSGGGLQQYLLAQNHPGLLDAGIAQYAYPDMVTQTIPIFDCELLEHYFDVTASADPLWHKASGRALVEGYSADDAAPDRYGLVRKLASAARAEWPNLAAGQTECTASWRGLTPLVLNPRYTSFADKLAPALVDRVHWSHFDDVNNVYGTDTQGFARVPWSNVGVQYGLAALKAGRISVAQFLDLNAKVGSWVKPAQMQRERFWHLSGNADSELKDFSPSSAQNIAQGPGEQPAPRYQGDLQAMAAAYRSGMVFLGKLDMPVIDLRHYLDPELDMHHAAATFSTRARIAAAGGEIRNQAIWMSRKPDDPTPIAFAAMDRWLANLHAHPERGVSGNRPTMAEDRCWDKDSKLIASGKRVWDGAWNGQPRGACMARYPIYSNTRREAGEGMAGDVFKCALQPVAAALARGLYAPLDMRPYQAQLERIFPDGVCDYSQPDRGRPNDLALSR
ncbi:DUF6351 family protein [Chitinimonas sp.]|uniref:DUF6351 family protein n=1 Tax=Chitinimonas sp. TaxID=1934313 RepID=UPI002F921581